MEIPQGYILIKESDFQAELDTITLLQERVKELEGQKNQDSHIPPSKGIVKVKNSREKTGKKQGGQQGHKGTTLEMIPTPDKIELHKVVSCKNCGIDLSKEISELMEDLTGDRIIESTINKQNERLYTNLELFEEKIKEHIRNCQVSHHDESGIYSEGGRIWLHSSSTKDVTNYGVDAERGKDATDRIGILPDRKGKIVHDNWATYFMYTNCKHGLCNAHHLREFTWFEEEENAIWANPMKKLLIDAKKQLEQAQLDGKTGLAEEKIIAIEKHYQHIIDDGIKGIPIPKIQGKKRGKSKKQKKPKQLNFLERFAKHKDSVLGFVCDFNVPFDNNLAERDIRMVKVKQKVSGTFRSLNGAKYFARTRSYISTLKKNKKNVFEEIRNALSENLSILLPTDFQDYRKLNRDCFVNQF